MIDAHQRHGFTTFMILAMPMMPTLRMTTLQSWSSVSDALKDPPIFLGSARYSSSVPIYFTLGMGDHKYSEIAFKRRNSALLRACGSNSNFSYDLEVVASRITMTHRPLCTVSTVSVVFDISL